jgi:methylated-DNA-protein-cysteine methyltransferase-like protein
MAAGRSYQHIYGVVARIPHGRVATYGQIARLSGMPGHARLVGYALSALREESRVPWHRVVNASGCISVRSNGAGHDTLQRHMLRREGVRFDRKGSIRFLAYQWRPKTPLPSD